MCRLQKRIVPVKICRIRRPDHALADAGWRKDLRVLARARRLFLHRLACPRLDDIRLRPRHQRRQHLLVTPICIAARTIGIGCPYDIAARRLIRKEIIQTPHRMKAQNLILYPNNQKGSSSFDFE